MAGYSGTPLGRKLGYRAGTMACVEGAPVGYIAALELPPDVVPGWTTGVRAETNLVHLFVSGREVLQARLQTLRGQIAPDCAVWVSWPKKASGVPTDVTEDGIRAVALPLGFVDIKVCAVDAVWSGLKLVIRRELRAKP